MRTAPLPIALTLALLVATGTVQAQTLPSALTAASTIAKPVTDPAQSGQGATTTNQLIERIHVEDGATRIDEVRVGGESRSISVAPKSGLPAYDVQPVTGARTWKIFGF